MSTIKDLNLAPSGERKIRWVEAHMPVLRDIGSDFAREKPFAGLKIALSVHLEAKTAYLCRVLEMGGAEMHVTGSNPLSTQDDVAAALAAKGMDVHAVYGCTDEEYQAHLRSVLSVGPNIIIDDGGDLVHLMHTEFTDLIPQVIGGCEETTTGIHRLRIMDRAGTLRFPMIMVNDADCKHLFDNRYGTGQSVWDGIMHTTNLIVAGKEVVVCCAGMGKANAAATTQVLITKFGAEKIIFSGIAGNMTSKIGIGDVVIGKTVLYHDAQLDMICQNPPFLKEYTGDPELIAAAEAACKAAGVKALTGKIATGDLFVGDSETKAAIEAKCAPDCVEMEGAAVSQIAAKNGVPCVILRAMSDNADEDGHEVLVVKKFSIAEYVATATKIVAAMVESL